jgi:hypothetical protein
MKRKTFDVAELKNRVNDMLQTSTLSAAHRQGAMTLLEDVLFSTGNYRGFRYLNKTEVPIGHAPGINIEFIGLFGKEDQMFLNTDQTRVTYN